MAWLKVMLLPLILMMSTLCQNAVSANVEWLVQSSQKEHSLTYQLEIKLANRVTELTNNEFIIKILPPNEIGSIRSAFNSTRTNKITVMITSPMYWSAADPVFAIMGDFVTAWDSPAEYEIWLQKRKGIRYIENAYHRFGLKQIAYILAPLDALVSTIPLRDIKDFKGQRMRTPPGMVTDFFKELGALTRIISLEQVASSLVSKQITIADYSNLVLNYNVGLYKIAKHSTYPGFHSITMTDFVVNINAWDNLDTAKKEALHLALSEIKLFYKQVFIKMLPKTLDKMKESGVTIHNWDEEQRREVRRLAIPVWKKYASKSPTAEKLVAELIDYLKEINNL